MTAGPSSPAGVASRAAAELNLDAGDLLEVALLLLRMVEKDRAVKGNAKVAVRNAEAATVYALRSMDAE